MEREELARRVGLYFTRIKGNAVMSHAPFEDGVWQIIGPYREGLPAVSRQPIPHPTTFYHGTFLGVVSIAVQTPEFYTLDGRKDDPSDVPHGFVQKVTIIRLPEPSELSDLLPR